MLKDLFDILVKPFTDILLQPYLTAQLRTLAFDKQFTYSEKLLALNKPDKARKAISILVELGFEYPYRRQEVVDRLCCYLREAFPQNRPVAEQWFPILLLGIRSVTGLPRNDVNGQPLNIDLRQMRIESIDNTNRKLDLTGINLKDVTMWGCRIIGVEMAKANLENCDLGGTVFDNCSLEWCNFKNARLNASFMDQGRPTTFKQTRLWGCNLNEAVIDLCLLQNADGFDMRSLQPLIEARKVQLVNR
jgi:hypothetical protein